MKIHLHAKSIDDVKGQTLVVFSTLVSSKKSTGKKTEKSESTAKITHSETNKALENAIEEKVVTGAKNEVISFRQAKFLGFTNVIVLGLGEVSKLTHENVRQAAAGLCKEMKAIKSTEAFVHVDGLTTSKKDMTEYLRAFVEGATLASYVFDQLKSKKDQKADKKSDLDIHLVSKSGKDKAVVNAFEEGVILSECTNFAKYLGDMPGNLMNPTILGNEAVTAAKGSKLKVTVWDKKRIEKEKMGGLLGVAQGSAQEPRFICMEYFGAAKSKKPVCFVGKGLTFDSGGISLKPGSKMEEMKFDMCGGGAVIGAMLAISQLGLKVNAIAFVPASENMPGSKATKPGDVHYARNGKSFEVNNTDAEGRLILSDALCWASEQKPEIIIDAATLTGAMVVALGNIHTGFFTKNSSLKNVVEKAATQSGELVWNMPFTEAHTKDMKGTYADLSNISYSGGAGSATAAAFLEQFVDSEIPWAHFDIAGTAWACGNRLNYCTPKGATGVMVRTFVEIARHYEK